LQTIGAAIYQQQQPPAGGPEGEAPKAEEAKPSDDKKQAEEGEVVK